MEGSTSILNNSYYHYMGPVIDYRRLVNSHIISTNGERDSSSYSLSQFHHMLRSMPVEMRFLSLEGLTFILNGWVHKGDHLLDKTYMCKMPYRRAIGVQHLCTRFHSLEDLHNMGPGMRGKKTRSKFFFNPSFFISHKINLKEVLVFLTFFR